MTLTRHAQVYMYKAMAIACPTAITETLTAVSVFKVALLSYGYDVSGLD